MRDAPAPNHVEGFPNFDTPPFLGKIPPRCPPFIDVESPDHLLPYLDASWRILRRDRNMRSLIRQQHENLAMKDWLISHYKDFT